MASHVEQQPVGAGASVGVISGFYGGMSQRRPGELYSPVRQIVCGGCGRLFYTRAHSKKYCNDDCAKQGFWRHKRERRLEKRRDTVCKTCGGVFTPKRADAAYCCNACRQKAYRQSIAGNGKRSK